MYAYISGQVTQKGTDYAIVETCGVGYLLFCSRNTLNAVSEGECARLLTHLHVSQDDMALYGFATDDERGMFRKLISVSRIGKKLAMSILSHLSVRDIAMAISTDNAAAFDGVPGMGKKTAARVLLELKEKVSALSTSVSDVDSDNNGSFSMRAEAIEALISLGYDGLSAGRAVGAIQETEYKNVEGLIRLALSKVTGGGGQ